MRYGSGVLWIIWRWCSEGHLRVVSETMVRGLDVRAGILRLDGGEHVCGRAHAHLA
jgi:hypothetical protein